MDVVCMYQSDPRTFSFLFGLSFLSWAADPLLKRTLDELFFSLSLYTTLELI